MQAREKIKVSITRLSQRPCLATHSEAPDPQREVQPPQAPGIDS